MAFPNNIAFKNLRAEMGRQEVTIQSIAQATGMKRDTVSRKLSRKSPLYLDEAFRIQNALFPDSDIRYLFAELKE